MIKKSTLAKKLASYSALASIVLLGAEKADGQILYHKLPEPDTLIGTLDTSNSFMLDLNGDGIADFEISAGEFTAIGTIGKTFFATTGKAATIYGMKKYKDQVLNRSFSTWRALPQPSALENNAIIGNARSKNTYKGRVYSGQIWATTGYVEGNYWYNLENIPWGSYNTQYFAGLRIKTGSNDNYGWVRLNLLKDSFAVKLVIYDYAYQQLKNTPIIAGDTGFFKSLPKIKITSVDSIDCGEDSFAIQSINIPEGAVLQWYRNDTLFETPTTDTTIILKQSGTYYAVVSQDGNSTVTNPISVEIPFLPEKPTIKQNQDSFISSEAFSYQWYVNSKPITGFTTREILPRETGYYQVMITDSNGCSNISDSLQVVITGIRNQSRTPKLFASNNVLRVQMVNSNFINGSLNIFNELSQPVLSQNISSENFTINLAELPAGIYFVRLEKNGQQIVRKIMIQ